MKLLPTRAAAALLIVLASPLAAQHRPDPAFMRLESGQRVRIETAERGRIEGRFERITPDMLSMELTGQPPVLIQDVEAFQVRGRSAGKGLLIGALVGVPTGALLGIAFCGGVEARECESTVAAGAFGAVVVGGSFSLLGALIGAAVPRWRLRYQRNPAQ